MFQDRRYASTVYVFMMYPLLASPFSPSDACIITFFFAALIGDVFFFKRFGCFGNFGFHVLASY